MHNHLRQNMCPEHPNRNLANGPNHPGPGPEEIPMVDVSFLKGFQALLKLCVHRCAPSVFFFFMLGYIIEARHFSHDFCPPCPSFSPRRSTYQRTSPRLNESYGLRQRDRSLPAMPLPDLTTLPREPIHRLTGERAPRLHHIQPLM